MGLLLWCYLTNHVVPRPTSFPPVAFFTPHCYCQPLQEQKTESSSLGQWPNSVASQ